MRTSLVAVLALLAPTSATRHEPIVAGAPPCVTATAPCERWITIGKGPSRTLLYSTYALDVPNPSITRALVMVHGAGRNADHYFETSIAAGFLAGALDNTIIIAPRFAAGADKVADNEVLWPERGQNWRSGGALATNATYGSFDLVDDVLRSLANKKNFPNLTRIVVAGHSAGGQFVTRYEMSNKVHGKLGGVAVSYVVANPSSYAWPAAVRPLPTGNADPSQADKEALGPNGEKVNGDFTYGPFDAAKAPTFDKWPAGLEGRTGYTAGASDDQLKKQLVERPTTYLLGQVDVLPLGGFDSSPNAMAQGPTRRARGEAFFKYITETLGAKQSAMIVPECGHNDRCIFTTNSVFPLLFPQ
ncbi:MAG: alpha/beta fold hydrolase [Gemmatimonadaceae bacterium]